MTLPQTLIAVLFGIQESVDVGKKKKNPLLKTLAGGL